ncbi:ribosome small subunit-dependent GTPase A [Myxococcota bacterium]|nr:ribosome small subunit-dependent GTPase A [Myxococcota bacterium]
MNGATRTRLEATLAALDPKARRRLSQRAATLQREARAEVRAQRRKGFRRAGPQPDDALHEWMLWALLQDGAGEPAEAPAEDDEAAAHEDERQGVVLSAARGAAEVLVGEETILAAIAPRLLAEQATLIAVGDEVTLVRRAEDRWELQRVAPRRSRLSRPDPQDPLKERVIAANVDRVVAVVAATTPPLRVGLLDRLLVAARRGGVALTVVVNKLDLADAARRVELDELLAPYEALQVAVHRVSASTGEGLDALRRSLGGALCVLVGASGVGKSSLLNALEPTLAAQTGEVSEAVGKGRHTTTRSTLYRLADGGRIIDTPGVRAFGLWRVGLDELNEAFPDVAELAPDCRYGDCRHLDEGEADCGVRRAAAEGRLSAPRLLGYQRIARSLLAEQG